MNSEEEINSRKEHDSLSQLDQPNVVLDQNQNNNSFNGLDALHLSSNLSSNDVNSEIKEMKDQTLERTNTFSEVCNNSKVTRPISNTSEGLENLLEKLIFDKETCTFSLNDFYRFALKFYKDKSGKAIHLSYEDNCYFVALSQQIVHGPFNPATAKTLGVFDVVGRDRRLAWQTLGDVSKEEAMRQFVDRMNELTPTFRPYIEAIWADHLERERLKKEEEERQREEEELKRKQEELIKMEEEERRRQEETKRQIQEALNEQTFEQFKMYVEQQFPGNPEQQGVLIKQLQEQHYQQYMQQVYQQQLLQQQQRLEAPEPSQDKDQSLKSVSFEEQPSLSRSSSQHLNGEKPAEMHLDEEGNEMAIAPANMWTRRDIKAFKSSIQQEGGDSIIKIGHGETVTVRVPTHEDGACLFWEFATDSYDVGFGILFEWRDDAASTGVTVHVTESDDEDDEEEEEDEGGVAVSADDVERLAGAPSRKTKEPAKPPTSVIIPVYRRDCYEEVYAGSHCYPGSGVYLLKFDNSYSLWRNKVLYYRVYYTQR